MSEPRQHILFVDDEEQILESLRNLLRRERKRWDLSFALGGDAALAAMAQRRVDVVVSDMRMPGMDGADLLRRVRDTHPSTVRIVLSGQAERDLIVRALPVVHQFLSKPCDADTLRSTLERTCSLAAIMGDERLRSFVGGIEHLPSVPHTYWELNQAISDPRTPLPQLAHIVESDPAMAIKTLQLVNSAYFGVSRTITSVHEAIRYLGLELLKALVLNAEVFSAASGDASIQHLLAATQAHSLLTAQIARRLCPPTQNSDAAFTAGVVHDIGRIVMALGVPTYATLPRDAHGHDIAIATWEREQIGATHAEVGAYLLGMWGLPLAIVEAVAQNHRSPGSVATMTLTNPLVLTLHVACALAEHVETGVELARLLDHEFIEQSGQAGELPRWEAIAKSEYERVQRATSSAA